MKSSAFLVTSTSIVFATPSRVTFTGTTFLPSLSVTFPYSTVSVSFNTLPFAVTFSFTASLSACSVKLSPALGTTEIFAAPSFTAKVKSSAFLVTSTSIVFATPSRVTFTGTTFLPSFSIIFPYATVSVSFNTLPFAVTLAFTVPLSASDNSAPTLGSTEISAASVTAKVKSSAFLVTSTSIVFATPSRVTVTGTTFLPSFSLIGPYVTLSVGLRASPFAVTFSFTFAWSSAVKLSPAAGAFEISTGLSESFTANANSLTSTFTI